VPVARLAPERSQVRANEATRRRRNIELVARGIVVSHKACGVLSLGCQMKKVLGAVLVRREGLESDASVFALRGTVSEIGARVVFWTRNECAFHEPFDQVRATVGAEAIRKMSHITVLAGPFRRLKPTDVCVTHKA
jgi:hypothetical protein